MRSLSAISVAAFLSQSLLLTLQLGPTRFSQAWLSSVFRHQTNAVKKQWTTACPSYSPIKKPRQPFVCCFSTKPPRSGPGAGGYSYVEGDAFGSEEDEIEALGGDPFFLFDDEDNNATAGQSGNVQEGGDDVWSWDGEIDENSYFDG